MKDMPGLNPLNFIPADFQQQILNRLDRLLERSARKVLGDEVGTRLKGLRSDAAFIRQFEAGLKRAADRFVKDYEAEDEDLTAAIADDPTFFKNDEIQAACCGC